jgi:hypothetical protein
VSKSRPFVSPPPPPFTRAEANAAAVQQATSIATASSIATSESATTMSPLSDSTPHHHLVIMSLEKWGTKALDHSHHISDYARRYALSPLKALQKYSEDDLTCFSGGVSVSLPHLSLSDIHIPLQATPDCYPFTSVSTDILLTDAFQVDAPRPASAALPLPRHLAGSGTSSVLARTIRHASISLVSHALVMEDSTSPRR